MSGPIHRFPRSGTVGLLLLLLMQTAMLCARSAAFPNVRWSIVTAWATPVCWWGYILVVDAWLYRHRGSSLVADRRRDFTLQCLLSIVFWCLFEAYNRLLPGWQYQNLDPHLGVRFAGYALAFATIMPGLFLTAALLQQYGLFERVSGPAIRWTPLKLRLAMALGALCVLGPPFAPAPVRGYLWAAVWVGWILLLEPVNYGRGLPSLFRDWENRRWGRTLQLAVAGALCGMLWEFWNAWAYTKWVYIFPVPLGADLKYFEMPLLGFLGFLPFALEYFVLFHFVASFYTREDKLDL